MARYGISIIKAPVLKNVGGDLTIHRDKIRFRVGYKGGSVLEEYFSEFEDILPEDATVIVPGKYRTGDVINTVNRRAFKTTTDDVLHLRQCTIAEFEYITTSDDKYAFTVWKRPLLQMVVAALKILKTMPETKPRDSLSVSLMNLIPNPKDPPKSSPSTNHEMLSLLMRVQSTSGRFLERQLAEVEKDFDNNFDFRNLLT